MAKKPAKRGDKTTNARTWSCSNSRNNGCVIKEVKAEPSRNTRGRCLNCGTGWINEDPEKIYGYKEIESFIRDQGSIIIQGDFGKIRMNLKLKNDGRYVMSRYGSLFAYTTNHETGRPIHAWVPQDLRIDDPTKLIV